VLSRIGPLGLSVLSLLASFVIVLTAGGVLATSSNPAPTPPPTPRPPTPTTVHINIAALQAGRDVDVPEGVEARLHTGAPPPLATATPYSGPATPSAGPATPSSGPATPSSGAATPGGQSATLLCLTLSEQWSLRNPSRVWTRVGEAYCRSVDPRRRPEVTVVLERKR
jgi:hypothetical protein